MNTAGKKKKINFQILIDMIGNPHSDHDCYDTLDKLDAVLKLISSDRAFSKEEKDNYYIGIFNALNEKANFLTRIGDFENVRNRLN